jgi:hypothetical protein
MTQDEIIFMARASGWISEYESSTGFSAEAAITFAKLVEENVRRTINEEAKAHLEELRKNFNAESAELRLHMWSQEKQAPAPYESSIGHMFGDKR